MGVTRDSARFQFSTVAAFFAVALLAFAGVRSTVMHAEMARAEAQVLCGVAPPDMAMGGHEMDAGKAAAHRACAFCSAAAHAPTLSFAAVFHAPTAVAFTPAAVTASLGPRGPPSLRPTATGPPLLLTL
ncbi:hypothetical protein BH09PSE2_BH09PSE2_10450 [soil metagenome]